MSIENTEELKPSAGIDPNVTEGLERDLGTPENQTQVDSCPTVAKETWGPYQLRPNPMAILRLALCTGLAIALINLIPDIIVQIISSTDPLTILCKSVGLWGYGYIVWVAGFLCLLHLVRICGTPIVLDGKGIKTGIFAKKIPWESVFAVTIQERKIFSRVFLIPGYQMSIHIIKPNGKRASKQIASFQYSPEEFFALFHYISFLSTGTRPRTLHVCISKDIHNSQIKAICDEGRLKSLAMTVIISFGLASLMAKNAIRTYSFNMGSRCMQAGHYDKAIGYFGIDTAIDPVYYPGWDHLARAEFRQGDLDSAEADWNTALKWKPDYVESKLGLSTIYLLRGKLDEAEKLIEKANRLAPLDEAAFINRAQIDALQGKTRIAIEHLEQFVKQKKGREQALGILARCYIQEGRPQRARAVLESDPTLLQNQFYRPFCTVVFAELSMAEGDYKKAENLLKPLARDANHHPELLLDFARLAMQHNDFGAAHLKLDAAAAINPTGPWIMLARAELAAREKDPKVDYWLSRALAFKYSDPSLMAACASFLESQGRHAEAVELAKKALALDSDNLIAARLAGASAKSDEIREEAQVSRSQGNLTLPEKNAQEDQPEGRHK